MSEDILLLGPAPRPQTSEALTTALRTSIAGLAGSWVKGLNRATIAARLEGAVIEELIIDLTGVEVPTLNEAKGVSLTTAEVSSSEATRVDQATLKADALIVAGARVVIDGFVRNLPATWVETTQGTAGLAFPEPNDPANPVQGEGQASVSKAELQAAALRIGRDLAKSLGVTLEDLKLDITQVSPQQLAVAVDARVKKGFIGANAHVNASATLDDAMNVTISNLQAGSKNPVINSLLSAVKGRIERYNGKKIAINDRLPKGVRLTHAEFQIADRVIVKGRVG